MHIAYMLATKLKIKHEPSSSIITYEDKVEPTNWINIVT